MKVLLIDSGNSAIKCRLIKSDLSNDQLFYFRREKDISSFVEYIKRARVSDIYLACVSGHSECDFIEAVVENNSSAQFYRLQSLESLDGLKNGYDNYSQLGVDRWLTILATKDMEVSDCIVVDAGSAITIDLVSRDQGHLGGAILAGFNTDRTRFQEIFPTVNFSSMENRPNLVPGKSTETCLQLTEDGKTLQHLQLLLNKWINLLDSPITILLSGQDAEQIQDKLGLKTILSSDLVFKGMLKQIQLQG